MWLKTGEKKNKDEKKGRMKERNLFPRLNNTISKQSAGNKEQA
jgi:hypothetical protein